ncbi:hypothetical protein L1049_019020 [Liquidambar formosana]|uniref:Uncharacterized protein n=1 Tax=Liquidambar formosana TaxID=63359 RepID=A0AAP0RAW3_LIQFO
MRRWHVVVHVKSVASGSDAPINGCKFIFSLLVLGCASEQGLGSSTAFHAAFGFLIIVLGALIQIKYQSQNAPPFETHPSTMLAFIIVVVLHVVALVVMIGHKTDSTSYLPVLRHDLLISSAIASTLLLRILVPLFGLLMLVLCAVQIVAISCVWCNKIFGLPAWADFEVFNKLQGWLRQFFRCLHKGISQVFKKSSTSCNSIEARPLV